MKKAIALTLAAVMLFSLIGCSKTAKPSAKQPATQAALPDPPAPETQTAEEADPDVDWTVLLYLCGTDLETDGGMATVNLEEIAATQASEHVNVLIQTGGTEQWHALETTGLDIAADKMQRYRYSEAGFSLEDEGELQNMADSQTLTEFIQWGAKNYPAKKYLLCLWDHGAGSSGGLIVDQKFGNATMMLENLRKAVQDAGVRFETVVLDTCLMASLETAQALQPMANYLVASEELVDCAGSAYTAWLQYLYDNPGCDGERFGRTFCDFFQQKYAETGSDDSTKSMTFSVIDLRKIDAVTKAVAAMFTELGAALSDPERFHAFAYSTVHTEHYDFPEMLDLSDMARRAKGYGLSDQTAAAVIEAVGEAVTYSIKGILHSYSSGLSFWYAPTASVESLDHYARNSVDNPEYLAFLDAANPAWTAPAWVYEKTQRLPERSYSSYGVEHRTDVGESGARLDLTITNANQAVAAVDAMLFQIDETGGSVYCLGRTDQVDADFEAGTFSDRFDGQWLMLNGQPCLVRIVEERETHTMYEIPVKLVTGSGETEMRLSAAFIYDIPLDENLPEGAGPDSRYDGHYEFYGLRNNASGEGNLPDREIVSLDTLEEGSLIYPLLSVGLMPDTDWSEMAAIGTGIPADQLQLEPGALQKGTYVYLFFIQDVLRKEHLSDAALLVWDGTQAQFVLVNESAADGVLDAFFGMELPDVSDAA